MGIHYAVELYFKIADVERALLATQAIAEPDPSKVTELILLDGKSLRLPVSTYSTATSVKLLPNQHTEGICVSLWFSLDEALQNYIDATYRSPALAEFKSKKVKLRNGVRAAEIGCIDLSIDIGSEYACFQYYAVTSDMSRLFTASQSVQNTFLDILKSTDGIIGLLFDETDEFLVLGKPHAKVHIEWEEFALANGRTDVDALTHYIIDQAASIG